MRPSKLTPELRRDLLRYLAATSEERARLIGELVERNPGMASLLMNLEADGDLRAMFEIKLLPES
jgi:hypothetical protein